MKFFKVSGAKSREVLALFGVDILRYTMNIFYGPFLSMYFFKISADTVGPISIYSMMAYAILGITPAVLGVIFKRKHQLATLRTGVILNFVYVLFIFVQKEQIVNHLGILAFLFGTSAAFYYFPHNMISGAKITHKIRANYELAKKVVISILGVLLPFLMGLFITTTDFQAATAVILVLSLMQIGLSFMLKPIASRKEKFTFWKSFRELLKHRTLRNDFYMVFFAGLLTSDSAMQVIMPLLIYNAFKTDLNLGIITSVTNLLVMILSFLYLKIPRINRNKWFLVLFAIVPVVGLGAYLAVTNEMTLVLYYVCFTLVAELMQLINHIKFYNVAGLSAVKRGNTAEYWSILEVIQGVGRVLGFVALFFASMFGRMAGITVVFAVLTCLFLPYFWVYWRVKA